METLLTNPLVVMLQITYEMEVFGALITFKKNGQNVIIFKSHENFICLIELLKMEVSNA